jgi:hypothetical protein
MSGAVQNRETMATAKKPGMHKGRVTGHPVTPGVQRVAPPGSAAPAKNNGAVNVTLSRTMKDLSATAGLVEGGAQARLG